MDQIRLQEKRGPNYVLLEASGTITSYTFTEFQNKVYTLVKENNLVIDLSETTKIDSSGLGVIMGAYNDAQEYGNTLYIMRPSAEARRALDSTGFIDTFEVIHSVTEVV